MTNRPPTTATAGWPMMERAIVAKVLGLPGYAAIGIALGFTGLGVFIDLERINGLGTVFKGCYFLGCVLSVCWVKRRALFGPMVQPPLLLAVAVPGVVLAAGGVGTTGGTAARLLAIGTPLLNGFPTMAVTTAVVLIIGIGRYRVQRPETGPERVRGGLPQPTDDARQARSTASGPLRPADQDHDDEPDRNAEPDRADERGRLSDPDDDDPTSLMPIVTGNTAGTSAVAVPAKRGPSRQGPAASRKPDSNRPPPPPS